MPLAGLTTARTPRNDLPYLFPGQAQKEAFLNEALARLDALVQPIVLGELASPPADPAPGDCYLLADDASDDWAGKDRSMAVWAGNQWLFIDPVEGARTFDLAGGSLLAFTAAEGWQRYAAPALPSGGTVQDTEARAAVAALIVSLRASGIFSA